MFVGHAGLAFLAAGRRSGPPLAVLLLAAYGPDWLKLPAYVAFWDHERVAFVTHSIVAVLLAGALAGGAWWMFTRERSHALLVALAWWSHWPADFATALKPTWPGGPSVGLQLYAHPAADLLIETIVLLVGWAALVRRRRPARTATILAPAALFLVQLAFVNQDQFPVGSWRAGVKGIIVALRR